MTLTPLGSAGTLTDDVQLATAATSRIVTPGRNAPTSVSLTSGRMYLNGFTPTRSMSISTLFAHVRGTAAATTTLARMGLFTVDATGAVALVARTANDTAMFGSTFTAYPKTLDTTGGYPASYTLNAGSRYALGLLVVATTAPALYGTATSPTVALWQPWMAGWVASQTDIATSYTYAQISGDGNIPLLAAY